MGVHNLWELLLPIGRRISIESLEGDILAIDASIWLTQLLTIQQKLAEQQQQQQNGGGGSSSTTTTTRVHYLANTLKRLCKLRYMGIRPVLVFDGATPEIKTRELRKRLQKRKRRHASSTSDTTSFLGDDSVEAVQRAAKRLLAKQLHKSANGKLMLKPHHSMAAAAAAAKQEGDENDDSDGFYDPLADERERQSAVANAAAAATGVPKAMQDDMDASQQQQQQLQQQQKEQEELNMLLKNDDYLNDDSGGFLESKNDWDTTGDVDAELDASNQASNDDESSNNHNGSSTSNQRPFRPNRRPGQPKQDKNAVVPLNLEDFHAGDGTKFAYQDVAHLDPTQRKDVIEHVKKKRYLASRKEYLQQAYDPEGLSQTQLRNFLKSTRLNRDIAKMAKQAAKLQERHKALNKEHRIIFEKDNDAKDDDMDDEDVTASFRKRPKPTAKQKQEQLERIKTKQKNLSLLQDTDDEGNDSDDDDNDDLESQDGINGATTPQQLQQQRQARGDNYFRKAVLDDDDDDDDDGNMGSHNDDDPTENGNGGGFFVPLPSPVERKPLLPSAKRPSPSKHIRIQDDDDDHDDDDDDKMEVWEDGCASSDDDKPPQAAFEKSDATLAQELQDETLARALQEEEDGTTSATDTGGFPSTKHDDSSTDDVQVENVLVSIDDESVVGDDSEDNKKPAALTSPDDRKRIQERQDEALAISLQDMEYEKDGAPGGLLPTEASTSVTGIGSKVMNDSSDDSEEDEVDWEDGESENEETRSSPSARSPPFLNKHAKESDNDSDVWEDGGGVEVGAQLHKKASNGDESGAVEADPPPELEDFIDDGDSVHDSKAFETNDWGVTRSSASTSNKELTEALEQAQVTAANLTNWAGRAFRRAVADHAAEQGLQIPESAKPKALKETANPESLLSLKNPYQEKATQMTPDPQSPLSPRNPCLKNATPTKGAFATRTVADFTQQLKAEPTSLPVPAAPAFDFLDTVGDLEAYQDGLKEANTPTRDTSMIPGGTASEEMRTEVIQLLSLFGIPYVIAPAEAEAQCVALERLGLVNGIVTEDSDAFVFGAAVVYKNLFKDQKWVEAYYAKDAAEEMKLNRDALVALAMLMGGDYTEGIKGVGLVNAMEILYAFDVPTDCKDGLTRFRKWLDGFDPYDLITDGNSGRNAVDIASSSENEFHMKHRTARNRWIAPKNFPDDRVFNAYWNPVVDTSEDRFTWGMPNVQGLVHFCQQHLGWPEEETKTLVVPVLERLQSSNGTMRQTRLDSFLMRYEDNLTFATVRSKRLQTVLKKNANKKKENQGKDAVQQETQQGHEDGER